jgi:sarcosine oxidase subunit alpha
MTPGPYRLLEGGREIDRSRRLRFTFEGRPLEGLAGDTVASALLANGVRVVGRSFKYHRPRGVWGAGVEEPSAILDLTLDGRTCPNARATVEPLVDGLEARAVNARPGLAAARRPLLDRLARFLPAGFYYKTFMWPHWHLFEPRIRALAGLGRLGPDTPPARADLRRASCDLLIVGAGPAGLACARAAARSGRGVMLVDAGRAPGGSLAVRDAEIDGPGALAWVERALAETRDAGAVVLARTTAFAIYDHHLVGLVERAAVAAAGWWPDRLWLVRAREVVIATGAIERPLVFPDNDRPGVMSADAALAYLRRFAVLPGRRIVVATNNDSAYVPAMALAAAGAATWLLDCREAPPAALVDAARGADVEVLPGQMIERAIGRREVEAVAATRDGIVADCLAVSGGWTPTVHLFCQARGRLRWDEAKAALVPGEALPGVRVIGAANGDFELPVLLAGAHAAGGGRRDAPRATAAVESRAIEPRWPRPGVAGRAWIDLQNDVTAGDVELAARESFRSVEHLKRYTTLGMATDQGKTAGLNGIALLAAATGRAIPEVGSTTFRPPYTPVPLTAMAGLRRGELMAPLRRLPAERLHRALGAAFGEYGGWLRPAWYGPAAAEAASVAAEARHAREAVALLDASSLGKIEVLGPDAARLLDFIYYNTVSTLPPGRLRYGLMLRESGIVFDDGVLARLAEDRFIVSCSSSHTAGVLAALEAWRQDRFARARIAVHDATSQWGTVTVTGPRARALLERLDLEVDLADAALPHMALATIRFRGQPGRIARVSFSGDRSYELSVPAPVTADLWQALAAVGGDLDVRPLGLEAMTVLRAEKGYIIVGKDTDGTTMPHDLGRGGPRLKRASEYVGRRSLLTEEACRPDRRQLVGLAVDEDEPLPVGAHGIERVGGRVRSIGWVTSSHLSPTLGRPIALGLIERGAARHGEVIAVQHLGQRREARLVAPCFLDPEGERLRA